MTIATLVFIVGIAATFYAYALLYMIRLALSYPFLTGASIESLLFWPVDIVLNHLHWLHICIPGLELAMTSSGC